MTGCPTGRSWSACRCRSAATTLPGARRQPGLGDARRAADPPPRSRASASSAVQEAMAEAKEQFDAVPATILHDVSAVGPDGAVRAGRTGGVPDGERRRAAAQPLRLQRAGAAAAAVRRPARRSRASTRHRPSPTSPGRSTSRLFSYDGSLDFGLIACREVVPDVWNLIGYLREALDELSARQPIRPTERGTTARRLGRIGSARRRRRGGVRATPSTNTGHSLRGMSWPMPGIEHAARHPGWRGPWRARRTRARACR